MLTASGLITRACIDAKAPDYTAIAADKLNVILDELCETYSFAAARGVYSFTFDTSLISNFGSGPYSLPLDYLRTSESSGSQGTQRSAFWTLNGVPYSLVPVDLAEWDMQVQQAGLQSYPWLFATDVSTAEIRLVTTGTLTANSTSVTALASIANAASSGSISGEGIVPGTTYTSLTGTTCTLSTAASQSLTGASLMFGTPPVAYVYPPPAGAYPVTIRYQRRMPPIADPANSTKIPWFPDQNYLLIRLTGELLRTTDDSRSDFFLGDGPSGAQGILDRFLKKMDDSTNRAEQVVFDRRVFGTAFTRLRNTKAVGF